MPSHTVKLRLFLPFRCFIIEFLFFFFLVLELEVDRSHRLLHTIIFGMRLMVMVLPYFFLSCSYLYEPILQEHMKLNDEEVKQVDEKITFHRICEATGLEESLAKTIRRDLKTISLFALS